ncbi:MAG: TldD/PmbA family protein [Ignisphaera sp.]
MEIQLQELSQKIVERALREGFSEAASLIRSRVNVMAKIANSELSVVQRWRTLTVDLYLAKDKRIFVLSLEPSNIEEVEKSIKDLMNIAGKVVESPFYAPLPKVEKVEPLNVVDRSVIEYMDKVDQIVETLIEVSHRENIDNIAGMVELGFEEKALSTSADVNALEQKTWLTGYIRAFASDGSGQWSYTSTKANIKGLENAAIIASRFAIESKGRVDIEPGYYDVILTPMVFGNLVNYLCRMSSAFSVLMGTSIFMKKAIGEKVASDKFSIYDIPKDTELPNATGIDDEGIGTYDKPIIENGVLKSLLHNTKTAQMMNTNTTGNAGWIAPHPWNILVVAGDATEDEMIASVRKGLLINNNWYTRMQNYVEGEFSTIARDAILLIENGRIVKPVNRVRIADTFNNVLKNIDMVGKELYNIQWWEVRTPTKAPYILIRNTRITKHVV